MKRALSIICLMSLFVVPIGLTGCETSDDSNTIPQRQR